MVFLDAEPQAAGIHRDGDTPQCALQPLLPGSG
jgi:hypothetical protein